MNLYLTAVVVRRFAALGLTLGAVFFGHHVINQATAASVNANIDAAEKTVNSSNPGTIKHNDSGDLEVKGANGTSVTVKGLPTAGR